jgi:hypothetical protein
MPAFLGFPKPPEGQAAAGAPKFLPTPFLGVEMLHPLLPQLPKPHQLRGIAAAIGRQRPCQLLHTNPLQLKPASIEQQHGQCPMPTVLLLLGGEQSIQLALQTGCQGADQLSHGFRGT